MLQNVSVITGGGSGMGLATAKIMGKASYIVVVGRTVKKLENAVRELESDGIAAEAYACDVADRSSLNGLAAHAKSLGRIAAVIHAAGLSPHMGDARTIMSANAMGTININEAFFDVMESGSCIINVSSTSAYLAPKMLMPNRLYKYSRVDSDVFMKKMMRYVNLFPKKVRSGVAYAISKHFVIWYAKTDAAKFGQKGVRVVSVTPGNFETPMGDIEREEAEMFTKYCAIPRFGYVEEIAHLLAFCASEKAGYLTGVDILCDGGLVASGVSPFKK
jgi:NAD(P)-dependent dehydrogenase (short-subunit alcohol dehydrogenase family)